MPAITLGLGQILVGDCRETLQGLPAASVHCVVTSPPYWALRDYKIEPVVWERPPGREPLEGPNAASSHPAPRTPCDHEWGAEMEKTGGGGQPGEKVRWQHTGQGPSGHPAAAAGSFCLKCNAWLGSLGSEPTPELFVEHIVECFREVWRVLRDDGTCWVNMGDAYASQGGNHNGRSDNQSGVGAKRVHDAHGGDAGNREAPSGLKPKDLLGMPWRVAFALQADGWYLRQAVPWFKRAPMPESCTDRMTTAHEYLFLLTKRERYYYDGFAVRRRGSSGPSDLRKMVEQAPRIGGKHKDLDDPLSMANKDTHIGQSRGVGNANRNLRTTDLSLDVAREALAFWSEAVKTLTKGGLLTDEGGVYSLTTSSEGFSGGVRSVRQVPVPRSEVVGGMTHRVEPGCPVHGSQDQPGPTASCGEHTSESQQPDGRIEHTHGPASPEAPSGHASTQTTCASCSSQGSPDWRDPSCSPSATGRSTESRRMDLAPETSPPCTACAGTPSRTDDTPGGPSHPGSAGNIPANSTEADCASGGQGSGPSGQTTDRIVDTGTLPIPPECTCSFYYKKTEKASHFATFPQALVRPLILAGTSERGCCPQCGKCWERVVERNGKTPREKGKEGGWSPSREHDGVPKQGLDFAGHHGDYKPSLATTGWRPGCACDAGEPVPCLVLDPFGGAGTVGLVAQALKRRYILCEIKQEYADMAAIRLRAGGDEKLMDEFAAARDGGQGVLL